MLLNIYRMLAETIIIDKIIIFIYTLTVDSISHIIIICVQLLTSTTITTTM